MTWFFDVRENSHCSEMNARSTAAALVNTPAASVPTARSVKPCDISGTVLCDETARFRVASYCDHSKAHLCINHAIIMCSKSVRNNTFLCMKWDLNLSLQLVKHESKRRWCVYIFVECIFLIFLIGSLKSWDHPWTLSLLLLSLVFEIVISL